MGLACQSMGLLQREQPQPGKVGVGPALMIGPATSAAMAMTFTQEASQPHAHPSVHLGQGPAVGVLEVAKPTPQARVDPSDDRPKAHPGRSPQPGLERLTQLSLALVPRPTPALGEAEAQELKLVALRVGQDAFSGGCRLRPACATHARTSSNALSACCFDWHRITKSSA